MDRDGHRNQAARYTLMGTTVYELTSRGIPASPDQAREIFPTIKWAPEELLSFIACACSVFLQPY